MVNIVLPNSLTKESSHFQLSNLFMHMTWKKYMHPIFHIPNDLTLLFRPSISLKNTFTNSHFSPIPHFTPVAHIPCRILPPTHLHCFLHPIFSQHNPSHKAHFYSTCFWLLCHMSMSQSTSNLRITDSRKTLFLKPFFTFMGIHMPLCDSQFLQHCHGQTPDPSVNVGRKVLFLEPLFFSMVPFLPCKCS